MLVNGGIPLRLQSMIGPKDKNFVIIKILLKLYKNLNFVLLCYLERRKKGGGD